MFTGTRAQRPHLSFSSPTMEETIVLPAESPSRPSSIPATFTWNAEHPSLPTRPGPLTQDAAAAAVPGQTVPFISTQESPCRQTEWLPYVLFSTPTCHHSHRCISLRDALLREGLGYTPARGGLPPIHRLKNVYGHG